MHGSTGNRPVGPSGSANSKKRPHSATEPNKTLEGGSNGPKGAHKKPKMSASSSRPTAGSYSDSSAPTAIMRTSGIGLPQVLSKGSLSKREAYVDKFKKLLELELKEDLKEVEARRKSWSRARLEREGYSIYDLQVSMSGTTVSGEAIMRFKMPDGSLLPYHQFQAGDVAVLRAPGFQVTMPNGTRMKKDSVDALIVDVDNYHILVTATEVPIDGNRFVWQLDKGTNRIAYDRMLDALTAFAKSSQAQQVSFDVSGIAPKFHPPPQPLTTMRNILLDDSAKGASHASSPSILDSLHTSIHFPSDFSRWKMNESQRATIKKALHRQLSLIQGPPGTGKTTTVVQLIRLLCHLYKNAGITILACAYTNVATDNLLEGCLDAGLTALRLGRPVKVRPELRQATLDSRVESHPLRGHIDDLRAELQKTNVGSANYKSLRDDIQMKERGIVREVMKSAQVICSTCIFAGDPMLKGTYFPVVIIDECTQATEPAALVPIVAGGAQQVILVGDHHQLPPTVKSEEAAKGGLSDSLFSRLIKDSKLDVFLLNTQYRMHPTISSFPSAHFYSGKILDGVTASERPSVPGFAWPNGLPVAFLNMPGSGESRGGKDGDLNSWQNEAEAVTLSEVTFDILETQLVPPKSIGIITPYSAQVKLIMKYLKNALGDFEFQGQDVEDDDNMADYRGHGIMGMTVSSVDGFQGREKEIILFSAVRSNSQRRLGFLTDWRRLNVALTRARRGVIVFGDADLLKSDPHWKAWIEWIESIGGMQTLGPSGMKRKDDSKIAPPLQHPPKHSEALPAAKPHHSSSTISAPSTGPNEAPNNPPTAVHPASPPLASPHRLSEVKPLHSSINVVPLLDYSPEKRLPKADVVDLEDEEDQPLASAVSASIAAPPLETSSHASPKAKDSGVIDLT